MQEPLKYSKHEELWFNGFRFHVSSTSVDWMTWNFAYERGYREPRHSVPAIYTTVEWDVEPGQATFVVIIPWKDANNSYQTKWWCDATGPYRRK